MKKQNLIRLLLTQKCIIDLQRNVLVFKSANIETKFLSESELPKFARLNNNGEEDEISMLNENQSTSSSSPASSTLKHALKI
jgi:hypothetical protein